MSNIARHKHRELIKYIAMKLAKKRLVLKGGGALMLAYNIDRHSVDIDEL